MPLERPHPYPNHILFSQEERCTVYTCHLTLNMSKRALYENEEVGMILFLYPYFEYQDINSTHVNQFDFLSQ